MAVRTYNDYLRDLLGDADCILACDTAADYLGLTNGGRRERAQIYVTQKLDIPNTEQIFVPSFSSIPTNKHRGIRCTTVNRTIVDLLEQDGDEQIITEALSYYYFKHNESFDGLTIPAELQHRFVKYCEWAIDYYCE